MILSLLDIALSVYQDRTTFDDVQLEQYKRFKNDDFDNRWKWQWKVGLCRSMLPALGR